MPHLHGERVTLREYQTDDIDGIRAWANDMDTVRYLSARYWMPQSYADAADFVDHAMRAGTNGAFFVIAARDTGAYLGQIDLFSINWRVRSAEMAIVMGRDALRGQGLGTEAIGLLLRYAFNMLGLTRVELEVASQNERAIRCYLRAGFVLEGVKRQAFMVDGKHADLTVMAVLNDEWRAAHPQA
jgi:RimJ/RimL family protein N-acetyltransferase